MPGNQSKATEIESIKNEILLADEILCPKCKYNLRGLTDDEINCPECGEPLILSNLRSENQNKNLDKIIHLHQWIAAIPCIVFAIICFITFVYLYTVNASIKILIVNMIGMPIWFSSFYIPYRYFESKKAIELALIMHVVLVTFPALLLGYIFMAGLLLFIVLNFKDVTVILTEYFLIAFTIMIATISASVVCFMANQYVLNQCKELYLSDERYKRQKIDVKKLLQKDEVISSDPI